MEPTKISLGAFTWDVPPLNLRQLRRLTPIFGQFAAALEMDTPEQVEAVFDTAIEIIVSALSRTHPEITADKLLDEVECSLTELTGAVRQIAEMSGLKPATPGEGEAARTGAASTDSSPQPADIAPATSTS